jgi:hypothetical protein
VFAVAYRERRRLVTSSSGWLIRSDKLHGLEHALLSVLTFMSLFTTNFQAIQTAFFNGFIVLNKFSLAWLVDSFLSEILGIPWFKFSEMIHRRWISKEPPPLAEISQRFHRASCDFLYNDIL